MACKKVFGKLKPPKLDSASPVWDSCQSAGQTGKHEPEISDGDFSNGIIGEFQYMDVYIHGKMVAAQFDAGSSIRIVS
jgi:hypothetical protein